MTPDVDRSDPYGSHRFEVEIDSIVVAGFSEVRGLSTTVNQTPSDDTEAAAGSEATEATEGDDDPTSRGGSSGDAVPIVSAPPGIAADVPQWQGLLGGALPWIDESRDEPTGTDDLAEGGSEEGSSGDTEKRGEREKGKGASLDETDGPTLKLRRGVTDGEELWDWFRRCRDGSGRPRDVRVVLLDSRGREVRGWVCRHAHPIRWDGPTLVAAESGVATETFELAHEGVRSMELGE
ncbi:MAG: phage tail protein [Haloferacaceae archaeon]